MADLTLTQLQAKWPGWRIWRGRRSTDHHGERNGDFVASRMTPTAGTDATVMADTPAELDRALTEQAAAVRAGQRPYRVAQAGPE